MKHSISALTLVASILALGATACEARDCDSTDRVEVEEGDQRSEEGACTEFVLINQYWEGDDVVDTLDYQADGNITVEGNNGSILVYEASGDQIEVYMVPAVGRPSDTCDGEPETDSGFCEEIDDDLSHFEANLDEDADGNWILEANLDGGRSTLKADIEIGLPTTFNGLLEINQGNGDVEVEGVQNAWAIDINNTGGGGIDLADAGPAERVLIENDAGDCNLNIGAPTEIDIFCDVSDLTVNIDGVPAGTQNRHIENGLGDLTVNFPSTDQRFTVQSRSGGSPITVTGSCEEADGSTDRAVTMTCNDDGESDPENGDPNYVVETQSALVDITLNL